VTIDRFTREQFEAALPVHKKTGEKLWEHGGGFKGEFQYFVPVAPGIKITIRSSVDRSDRARSTGQDSIRAWLVRDNGQPLGSKVSKYITRVPGWDKRLTETLRILWAWARKAGYCPDCKQPKLVFKVKKKGPNTGRIFAKCQEHGHFTWLTDRS